MALLPSLPPNHSGAISIAASLVSLWLLLTTFGPIIEVDAFVAKSFGRRNLCHGLKSSTSSGDNNDQNQQQTLDFLREKETRRALIEAQLYFEGSKDLQEVHVLGQAQLPTTSNSNFQTDRFQSCVVLSTEETAINNSAESSGAVAPGLLLPLSSPAQLKLLKFAKSKRPLSKSVLLGLNSLLVNRDGALFDNLPWSQWSVDPQKRNYDAAGNPIAAKFHLGKRDAYNRLMGKDWQGRSVSVGNMALRLKYLLEADEEEEEESEEIKKTSEANNGQEEEEASLLDDDSSKLSLAQRILELQIRELEMDLAEWDYQLAVAKNNNPDQVESLEQERKSCESELEESRQKLQILELGDSANDKNAASAVQNRNSLIGSVMDDVADWTTDYGKNKAPYRGAIGYAPALDTKQDIEKSVLPYTSPYDVLKELLDDQLNCEVIGSILENTSLLEGTLALGGALILRRKTAQKTVTLAGEEVQVQDEEEDYGNVGGTGGETMLVECDADEAIAMGLTCGSPIYLEPGIWERSSIMVGPMKSSATEKEESADTSTTSSLQNVLPFWTPLDPELSVLQEGQAGNESSTERVSPIRIPRTTASLFDSIFQPKPASASSEMFPTDNPIQSLNQYDELSNDDKARTLMTMSNFQGRLPRPRAIRESETSKRNTNPLDNLLLPLIDESVRRQYRMRDAELRGDTELLEQLKSETTRYQTAKEFAQEARDRGEDDVAERWESEAELYGSLRADITQDEGSYSRFLDRDADYERTRRVQAKKLDKKKFGTLLDGIE